jgi:hypothetical protein
MKQKHRGKWQVKPARTFVWAKDGVRDRARKVKNLVTGGKTRTKTVESEA